MELNISDKILLFDGVVENQEKVNDIIASLSYQGALISIYAENRLLVYKKYNSPQEIKRTRITQK